MKQQTRKISGMNCTWKLNADEKEPSISTIQQESSKYSESCSSHKSNNEIKLKISQEVKSKNKSKFITWFGSKNKDRTKLRDKISVNNIIKMKRKMKNWMSSNKRKYSPMKLGVHDRENQVAHKAFSSSRAQREFSNERRFLPLCKTPNEKIWG